MSKPKAFKDLRGQSLRVCSDAYDSAAFAALSPHDVLALAFTGGAGRGTIRLKPKGPVRRNTFSEAVAAPTEKRGFVTPNFWGWCVCTASRFWSVVGVIRKDARTASDVFLTTTLHPTRVETLTVALVTPEGAKTMTASPVASRSAAPITTPITGNTTPDLVQLHLQACNALAQALHTLRNSDCTASDLHRAIGRTMRAATAIKRMAGEVAA